MLYYVVSGTFSDPLPVSKEEIKKLLPEHKAFISRGLRDNRVLCAGPKTNGSGGCIIVSAESRADLEEYIATDPFYQQDIQHYDITEFSPDEYQEYLDLWL